MSQPARVFVISDLHIGLDDEMCMFHASAALARFIDWCAVQAGAVELVILGDGLDYLQIAPWLAFDPDIAVNKTERMIVKNPAVFAALAGFRGTPDKTLVWSVGNHDIELLFPAVRAVIETRLGGAITWRLDETPRDYALPLGGTIRLIHGNGPDPFNWVDFANLEQVLKGEGDTKAVYPHGSHMVANIFNPLKAAGYTYVDLLKPEEGVALPLTLALWPKQARKLWKDGAPGFLAGLQEGVLGRIGAWIGQEVPLFGPNDAERTRLTLTEEELTLEPVVRATQRAQISAEDLSAWLEDPSGLLDTPRAAEATFGPDDRIPEALLREAARRNATVDPFDPFGPDAIGEESQRWHKDGVVVVIAGHTHLARMHEYPRGWYFNSGTWADLMRLPPNLTAEQLKYDLVHALEHLKDPRHAPAWLRPFRRLTFVDIQLGKEWSVRLRQWPDDDVQTIAGTHDVGPRPDDAVVDGADAT